MEKEKLLKMKEKIQALIALGDSEKKLGNEGAAALIAEKVNELMQKFKLEESDFVKEHPEIKYEPIIGSSSIENPFMRANARYRFTANKTKWAEYLAAIIGEGHYCRVMSDYRTGKIYFFGTDFDREIAILMFEKLSEMAYESCVIEMDKLKSFVGKKAFDYEARKTVEHPKTWMGDDVFINNFMFGYGQRLLENYAKVAIENKQALFDKINKFIESGLADSYNLQIVRFDLIYTYENVIAIGKKYGNYTAKKKSTKLQKGANITISKKAQRVEDDRIGEVMLIIDDSGSMMGEKIVLAREGIKDFAQDAVNKKFAVGLIKFGYQAELLMQPKLELNGEFSKSIEQLNAQSGSTYLYKAMKLAVEKFSKFSNQKKVILIATDGQAHDADQCVTYSKFVKASGIEIMTIGTNDADKEFLEEISSGKKTLQVTDSDLRKALKGMAGYLTA